MKGKLLHNYCKISQQKWENYKGKEEEKLWNWKFQQMMKYSAY